MSGHTDVEEQLALIDTAIQEKDGLETSKCDTQFAKRLFALVKLLISIVSSSLFILLLLLSFAQVYIVSFTGSIVGSFYQSIVNRDEPAFRTVLWQGALVVIAGGFLESTLSFLTEYLAITSRRRLGLYIHQKYLKETLYFKVQGIVDNTDQRIAQDVDNFCTTLFLALSKCSTGPFIVLYYTFLNWTYITWYSVPIIYFYFLLGYGLNKLIMSQIAGVVYEQERLEGDYRFTHARIRANAESIAMYRGHPVDKTFADKEFGQLVQNKKKLTLWHYLLTSISNLFSYPASVLSYVIVALPVFYLNGPHHDVDSKFVATAAFYCIQLMGGFSQVLNVSEYISDLTGYTARIAHLLENLQKIERERTISSDSVYVDSGNFVKFENVTATTPNGRTCLQNLSFAVQQGTNLLITGPSGCGKTSLVRVLNGLWPFRGRIIRPEQTDGDHDSIMYLPQQPYLLQKASIAQQIIYPLIEVKSDNQQVTAVRKALEFTGLDERFPNENELISADTYSPGEQQIISFARLFFHKPKFAILDEATSALPHSKEREMYSKCIELGITFVSIGHRRSLRNFHQLHLTLDSLHRWKLEDISMDNLVSV